MPKGSCVVQLPYNQNNPATYNVQNLSLANGEISVVIRYGWDGVSVFPYCVGPVHRVRVMNTGSQTWYVRIPRARVAGTRLMAIPPGFDETWNAGVLSARGIDTLADIEELTLTLTSEA